jgi:hypothetical protein
MSCESRPITGWPNTFSNTGCRLQSGNPQLPNQGGKDPRKKTLLHQGCGVKKGLDIDNKEEQAYQEQPLQKAEDKPQGMIKPPPVD